MRIPPASAPYALPMPPTITAAKMLSTMPNPRFGVTHADRGAVDDAGEAGEAAGEPHV